MQKKRNVRLLLSLIALIIITSVVYMFTREGTATETVDNNFKIEELNSVSRVIMQSAVDTVDLTFNGSRWRVSDVYDADRQLIDLLFATLQQVKVKRPVAVAIADSISLNLKKSGVRVSLYEHQKLVKTFFAGGNAQKNQAFFMDERSIPYSMVIPGYHVYVSGILELDRNGWRDKYVFNFNWRNLQRVEVTFPGKASQNFSVTMDDTFFGIEGMPLADTSRLNSFLDNVSLLAVDKYLKSDPELTDSLMHARSAMRVVVKDVANRQFALSVYLPVREKYWILCLVDDNQPALFEAKKIRDIIRPKSYFLKE